MEYVIFGRTGLSVSLAGVGCGGHSRLGLATGHDHAHARDVVAAGHRYPLTIRVVDLEIDDGRTSIVERCPHFGTQGSAVSRDRPEEVHRIREGNK